MGNADGSSLVRQRGCQPCRVDVESLEFWLYQQRFVSGTYDGEDGGDIGIGGLEHVT
jgi:hypothetical protein